MSFEQDVRRTMERILDSDNHDLSLDELVSKTLRDLGGKSYRVHAKPEKLKRMGRRLFNRRRAASQLSFDFGEEA